MEVDEFFDLQVVGLGDDLVALAEQEGEKGCRAGLVIVPAGVAGFEADVGAGRLALGIHADLLRLLVVHAGHMFHIAIIDIKHINRTLSSCAAHRCKKVPLLRWPWLRLLFGFSRSLSAISSAAAFAPIRAISLAGRRLSRLRVQQEHSRKEHSIPTKI